jgi:hypothetical protein
MADFRSDPMPTPDGHGKAKNAFAKAWAKYSREAVYPISRTITFDIFGFWIAWNLYGGFEGLMRSEAEGGMAMSRSAVYRRIQLFRMATGFHPDDFSVPGITIDVEEYLKSLSRKKGDTPK